MVMHDDVQVVEERLLHDVKASSAIVVGFEGLWGLIMVGLVALPVAQVSDYDSDGYVLVPTWS